MGPCILVPGTASITKLLFLPILNWRSSRTTENPSHTTLFLLI